MVSVPWGVRWLAPLLALPVIALAYLTAIWLGQQSLVYRPDRSAVAHASTALPGALDVTLATADGLELGAWYLPPVAPCTSAVLVAHGNGGNRAHSTELARGIHERGFGVLVLDYRGYGGNPGRPTEPGLALDIRAARSYLLDAGGIPEQQLVYLGESLGTGVITELAVEFPPAALVLRSPLTTLDDAGRAIYRVPVGWMLRERYPVRDNIGHVHVPTAILYGTEDSTVPASQSKAVAQVARRAGAPVVEVEVPGAGHTTPELTEGPALIDALVRVAQDGGVTGCR